MKRPVSKQADHPEDFCAPSFASEYDEVANSKVSKDKNKGNDEACFRRSLLRIPYRVQGAKPACKLQKPNQGMPASALRRRT